MCACTVRLAFKFNEVCICSFRFDASNDCDVWWWRWNTASTRVRSVYQSWRGIPTAETLNTFSNAYNRVGLTTPSHPIGRDQTRAFLSTRRLRGKQSTFLTDIIRLSRANRIRPVLVDLTDWIPFVFWIQIQILYLKNIRINWKKPRRPQPVTVFSNSCCLIFNILTIVNDRNVFSIIFTYEFAMF